MTELVVARLLSVHLHFAGALYDTTCDEVLLRVVEPLVNRWTEAGLTRRFFFVRYGEEGPHVRLRLEVLDDGPPLRAKLAEVIAALARPEAIAAGGLPAIDVRWVNYEPELDRYGGPAAISVAEDIFDLSSRTALALLSSMSPPVADARRGRALLAMLVTLHAFCEHAGWAAAFSTYYGNSFLKTVAPDSSDALAEAFHSGYDRQAERLRSLVVESWATLDAREPLLDVFDDYHERLLMHRGRLQTLARAGLVRVAGHRAPHWESVVQWVVPSLVHMMCNRIGVTVLEEVYLAHLITDAVAAAHGATRGAAL